jgi:fructose-bisphosphate aldolase class II
VIQIFPWTLPFYDPYLVLYAAETAHATSVPITLHLNHYMEPADIELALTVPFDSIMINASSPNLDKNISMCKDIDI